MCYNCLNFATKFSICSLTSIGKLLIMQVSHSAYEGGIQIISKAESYISMILGMKKKEPK